MSFQTTPFLIKVVSPQTTELLIKVVLPETTQLSIGDKRVNGERHLFRQCVTVDTINNLEVLTSSYERTKWRYQMEKEFRDKRVVEKERRLQQQKSMERYIEQGKVSKKEIKKSKHEVQASLDAHRLGRITRLGEEN